MREASQEFRDLDVQAEIEKLLLAGSGMTMDQAENAFLDAHLDDIAALAALLSDDEFCRHEAVRLLLSHGSRTWEDELR